MALGMEYAYSTTEPIKRTVTDRIIMADPLSIVLISALGLNNESKFKFLNTPGKTYEWLEDTFSPREDTLNTATITSDTTLTILTVTNGSYFQAGDVILLDLEYMYVTSVATNVLNVTRGFGGTQATHANAVAVYITGRNRLEGASAGDGHFTEPTTGYNYSAILQKSIEISRSNALLQRYGIPDLVNWEIDKKMAELLAILNLQGYHGQRKVGSTSTPRGFGGLGQLISTNATANATVALTRGQIETAIQQAWGYGNPTLLFCGAWAKRKIASFYEGYVKTERSEMLGGIEIDKISSPLGINLSVIVDRACPTKNLYIVDPNFAGFITVDPFFEESLGKSKDTAYFGQVVGEYGFVLANEKAHAKITNFSITT
jgi:hypothetical protein